MKKISLIFLIAILFTPAKPLFSQDLKTSYVLKKNQEKYDSVVSGIHIYPGMWRPFFGTEQIAWVNPPWINEGFIWLDYPEAIFTDTLLFLSHIDPRFPAKYPDVKNVPWQQLPKGISYEQVLPDGIRFKGYVLKKDSNTVSLELQLENGSNEKMETIRLQTCMYLYNLPGFNKKTNMNKYVHIPEKGWISLEEALQIKSDPGKYPIGWREGHKVADLPVIVVRSEDKSKLIGFTWWENTFSLIGNPAHPCMHADPWFPDLDPGETYTIHGNIFFFTGSLADFEKMFRNRMKTKIKSF